MNFLNRVEQMGLQDRGNGLYLYSDRFSQVIYRTVHTKQDESNLGNNFQVPYLALFTRKDDTEEFGYRGIVSQYYQFIGNDVTIQQILQSISEIGSQSTQEISFLSPDYTTFYSTIILRNGRNVPQIGDVYPQLTIRNSYNGTLKQKVAFGIYFNDNDNVPLICNFRNSLGEMSRKHHESSQTTTLGISRYVNLFSENISTLFANNLNTQLTADDILKTLDMIEEVGKNRRKDISKLLSGFNEDNNNLESPVTAWSMFLTILRYTSSEQNINAKVMLENIAERSLIIPTNMMVSLLN